ncbi:MAG: hypothetical protein V7724_09730 [Sediminicola sp.]|tara:strand:- start:4706 stop:5377 length:672 start_codon:yes stop_codon:yes gene_type:complete
MENRETLNESKTSSFLDRENLLEFYKHNLPGLLRTVFTNPISGVYELFAQPLRISYQNTLLMMGSTVLLYVLAPILVIPSQFRSYLGISVYIKTGMVALIFMMVLSGISFGIKSISGRPSFKKELLTGALSGIGLVLLLVTMLLIKILVGDIDAFELMNPTALVDRAGLMIVFVLYVFLFLVNVLQQSLKASGTKDGLCWYISPLGIIFAFYVTAKIVKALFM